MMTPASKAIVEGFFEDLRRVLEARLIAEGFDYAIGVAAEKGKHPQEHADQHAAHWTLCRYLDLSRRRIPRRPRRCIWSRELQQRALSPDLHQGIDNIVRASEAGDDLLPFHSRFIEKLEYDDMLLNDWGILHLHLGLGAYAKAPQFVDRRGELLFVMVRRDELYLIDVLGHEWHNSALIEIVHSNWPSLIQHAHCPEVVHVYGARTDEQRLKMRNAGFMTLIGPLKDGTVYTPPGGGNTMSGLNFDVLGNANEIFTHLRRIAEVLEGKAARMTLVDDSSAWRIVNADTRESLTGVVMTL